VGDVLGQPWLGARQDVGDARGPQQDQRRVGGADAGQPPQVAQRFFRLHGCQAGRVELAVKGSPRHGVQPCDPPLAHPGKGVGGEEVGGQRERGDRFACHGERRAGRRADPGPDRGRLGAVPARADDRPRRRLVRRVEQDRAQPLMRALQPAEHRVPFAGR